MSDEPPAGPDRWLLLIHQLPAKPAYARVKLWRRLQALGAVAVKNAVHALPAGAPAQEDFEWVLKEITEAGGEGMILLGLKFRKHFCWARSLIVAERQSAFSLIVARVGGLPGPRLRSRAARRR